MNIEQLKKDLKVDEGFRDCVYQCSAGANTIGYGWNMDALPLSLDAADFILEEHIFATLDECAKLPWFTRLSHNRQNIIINMVFNMGMGRFLGFKNMIQALKDSRFNDAALEMLDSKWARQVGLRADRLSAEMREG